MRRIIYAISTVIAGVFLLLAGTGCQSTDLTNSSEDAVTAPGGQTAVTSTTQSALIREREKAPILATALGTVNVASAREMLESEGYAFVEHNSIVLMQHHYRHVYSDVAAARLVPGGDRLDLERDLVRADTVTWLAFENPTHDMANHTAVLQLREGDREVTLLVELNVGVEPPVVIREGKFEGGEWIPGDVGTDGWLKCVFVGGMVSGTGCALSNCAYGACLATGGAVTLVGCTARWLWDKFF